MAFFKNLSKIGRPHEGPILADPRVRTMQIRTAGEEFFRPEISALEQAFGLAETSFAATFPYMYLNQSKIRTYL
jgi:hypothetical protein